MRCFFLVAASSLMLPSLAQADHSDDTLRYYLSKTELCVAGTIASEPIGIVGEAGVVNYACDFAVAEVLKGELQDKTIQVNVIRHEMGDVDRTPNLKKDAKCILFLKAQPRSIPPWETVDFWFGYQPHSSTMARAIKRVAQSSERPDAKGPDEKRPDGKSIKRTAELAGEWRMALPSGAMFAASIRAEGDHRLHLASPGRFTGIYELRDGRLVMVKPGDPAEVGFEWEVRGADELVLVAQRKLEFDYRGATLKRLKDDRGKDDGGAAKAPADRPAPEKADRPTGLAGTWRMTLPRGAQYTVALRPEGEKRFHLESAVRFSGLYELRDGRLLMVKPLDPAEMGFEWEVREPDALTLVAQRERAGANYLGTTLTRLKDAEKPLKDDGTGWGPPVDGLRGRVETKDGVTRFVIGEPVWIVGRMANFAKRATTIHDAREHWFQLKVVGPDGKPVPHTAEGLERLPKAVKESVMTKLHPAVEVSETFRLDELFELTRPGEYKVSFTHGRMTSNELTITLTARRDSVPEPRKGDDGAGGDTKPKGPTEDSSTGKAAADWDSAAIDGAFMFRDAAEFQTYLAQAEKIAIGTLATWDGSKGTLKVQRLCRGEGTPDSLSLSYTGGTVVAKTGEKVLVLTAGKDGKLHSYCAASGLFRYSDTLASHVEKALSRAAPPDDMSAEETKAAEALQQIKLEHRLRKEPDFRAPAQYCLLLLGREAKTRLWLASDGTTMYVDRNGNGDLTDPDEAIPFKNGFAALMADAFPGHGGDGEHTSLHIAVRQRDWEKNTGGYWALRADVGRTFHMYAMVHKFARKPQDAPVVHLGGPLRMGLNHLYGGTLVRGRAVELEAYAACHYPGVERAFVDVDRRCPKDVHPIAKIGLPGIGGAEPLTLRVPLTRRC